MKSMKKLLIISMLVIMIFCVSAVNASDDDATLLENNVVTEVDSANSDLTLGENFEETIGVDENESASSTDELIIYVGTNGIDGGNGSYDNPFTTFKAASEATNGENNVIINVFPGTYYLGEGLSYDANTPIRFNTNNLNIIGNGTVIIKNYFNVNDEDLCSNSEAFSLVSPLAKFTFTNLIFDASDCVVQVMDTEGDKWMPPIHNFFLPFYGMTELGVFDNCTFKGFATKVSKTIYGLNYDSIFRNCNFQCGSNGVFGIEESIMSSGSIYTGIQVDAFTLFENCIMSIGNSVHSLIDAVILGQCNMSISDVWFGQNGVPNWIYPDSNPSGFSIPVNRYAIFSVTQEYLGNDMYKIIGKLTWNGTDDQDGMENFQPMTVKLVSEYGGELASEVKLINGTFETIYKNSASTHFITATLDSQPIELEFTTVNITAEGASIYYGEDQNITVNLSQVINNNVTIVVSNAAYNKTYVYEVNGTDSFNFTIPKTDWLKAGTYNITITLNENNLYGIGTTTLTVSKVSDYKFDVVPSEVKFGGTETITITLPDDVDGTVTVQFGNETQSSPAKPLMTFNFIDLKVITYDVNVTYSGNDKYVSKSIPTTVTVNKADSGLEINDAVFAYGEDIVIPFTVTNANGVTVSVLNEDDEEVNTTSSSTDFITLGTLDAGEYTLEVTTVVDKAGNYDWITKESKLTITKTDPLMNVIAETAETITVKDNVTLTVGLPSDATGNVVIRGNGKKLYNVSANETLTFNLSPDSGDYVVDAIYSGDKNYENDMKTNEFIVFKAETTVTANPIVFEEGNSSSIEVNVPDVDSGIIQVYVADKKFFGDINAGKATVLIFGLDAGNYTAEIRFAGNEKFNEAAGNVAITVTSAIDITIIAYDVTYGDDVTVSIVAGVDGEYTVTLNNETKIVDVENNVGTLVFTGLNAGNYTAVASYSGDDSVSASCNVKISKATPEISVIADDIIYGEKLIVNLELPADVSKRPIVTVENESKFVTIKNGIGSVKFTDLTAGTHQISVTYDGDDNYLKTSVNLEVNVNKATPEISISAKSIKYGENLIVDVTLPDDVSRRAIVTIDNTSKAVSLKNGTGSVKFTDLTAGTHEISATYDGDNNYAKASAVSKVKVAKATPDIKVSAKSIKYGENLIVDVTLPDDVSRRAIVTIDNTSKAVSLKNGVGSVKFTDLGVGTHEINVAYDGDRNYAKYSFNTTVKVNRGLADINVVANSVSYGEDAIVIIQLPDDVTRRAVVTIGNESKTVTLTKGLGMVKFAGLKVGTHEITVSYDGDSNYVKSSVNATVKVNKATPDIQITANDITEGEKLTVEVKLPADVSKRATVTIDDVTKYVTVKDGAGSVKFDSLSKGTHEILVSYAGDANYKKTSNTTMVTVS